MRRARGGAGGTGVSTVTVRPAGDADRAALFALRHEVFVLEQAVPDVLERNEHDPLAEHVVAVDITGRVVGTGRVYREGAEGLRRSRCRAHWPPGRRSDRSRRGRGGGARAGTGGHHLGLTPTQAVVVGEAAKLVLPGDGGLQTYVLES